MKAITTTYHGVTERRAARIIASDEDGNRATVPYASADDGRRTPQQIHGRAAELLARKMGWTGRLQGGSTRTGYVWVWIDSGQTAPTTQVEILAAPRPAAHLQIQHSIKTRARR
jgi:hypothetical protein